MGNQAPRENSMVAQGNPPTIFYILDYCLRHPCFLHGTLYLLLTIADLCCPIASSSLISLLQSFVLPLWASGNAQYTEMLPVYSWQDWWCMCEGSLILKGCICSPGDCCVHRINLEMTQNGTLNVNVIYNGGLVCFSVNSQHACLHAIIPVGLKILILIVSMEIQVQKAW